ncbi:MAG: hypothetical protein Q4F84_05125, partial [Fibrobacter sp.]|nr:hypothetical protein [Fibrobacter sp.]
MVFDKVDFLIKNAAVVIVAIIFACSPPEMNVYVRMLPRQEKYFANEVEAGFGAKNRAKINVRHYESIDSLEKILSDKNEKAALVKVPFDDGASLMKKGDFIPLDSILPKESLEEFRKEYLLMYLGAHDGKQYFVPRKFETRIMAYAKSKVADVVAVWQEYKDQIDAELGKYNGVGLPGGYLLEEDPEQWDYFDLFVAGWVWAHREYNGKKTARIVHLYQDYSNISLRIIDRIFQLGGDLSQLHSMVGDAVV